MSDQSQVKLVSQAQDYFRELVIEALRQQQVKTQPETEFYLVNLLNQFICTDQLFPRDAGGEGQDAPLALLLKDALEQPKLLQGAKFKQIGDLSLYKAGFFQESLTRKLVDVDYYIEVGGAAYREVAVRSPEDMMKSLYLELSQKFASLVEVLAVVGDRTRPKAEADLLRMYELWVRTRSERAARALQEAGILPNETIKKDWQ